MRPRLLTVLARALVIGAFGGLVGGALIFFTFGFIGFAGASIPTRAANGWDAVVDVGLGKGLLVGIYMAGVLITTIILWWLLGGEVHPLRSRPWLAGLAAVVVVMSNLESLRNTRGWDPAGSATVTGMALLVGGIVWLVTPWALSRRPG